MQRLGVCADFKKKAIGLFLVAMTLTLWCTLRPAISNACFDGPCGGVDLSGNSTVLNQANWQTLVQKVLKYFPAPSLAEETNLMGGEGSHLYQISNSAINISVDPSYTPGKDTVRLLLNIDLTTKTQDLTKVDDLEDVFAKNGSFYITFGTANDSIGIKDKNGTTIGTLQKPEGTTVSNGQMILKQIKGMSGTSIDSTIITGEKWLKFPFPFDKQNIKTGYTLKLPIIIDPSLNAQTYYVSVAYKYSDQNGTIGTITKTIPVTMGTTTGASLPDYNPAEDVQTTTNQQTSASLLGSSVKCILYGDDGQSWVATGIDFAGCVSLFVLNVLVPIASFVVFLAGQLMDMLLSMSISSSVYRDISFVLEGWRIVRDLCNLLFIFILIYVSISMILGGGGGEGGSNPKKMIAQLVLIAVVINFSLFLTRIVIDSGNVLAHVFYNQISTCGSVTGGATETCQDEQTTSSGSETTVIPAETKSLSLGLMKGINPQQILSKEMVDKMSATQAVPSITIIVLGLMLFALMIGMAVIFFKMAGYFIGRIAGLWLLIIGAPLAFLSTIIPSLNVDMFSWKKWISNLITLSMMPALFLFFIYITFLMINPPSGASILKGMVGNQNLNAMESLVLMALAFALIYGLLSKGADISKKMAGEAGSIVANLAQGALSFAVGAGLALATGGAAMAGRAAAGAAAKTAVGQKFAEGATKLATGDLSSAPSWVSKTKLGRAAAQKAGMLGKNMVEGSQKASFDVRQTTLGNAFSKGFGVNMNSGTEAGLFGWKPFENFSSKAAAGGYEAMVDRKVKKQQEIEKSLGFDKQKKHTLEVEQKGREKAVEKLTEEMSTFEELDKDIERKKNAGQYGDIKNDPNAKRIYEEDKKKVSDVLDIFKQKIKEVGATGQYEMTAAEKSKTNFITETDKKVAENIVRNNPQNANLTQPQIAALVTTEAQNIADKRQISQTTDLSRVIEGNHKHHMEHHGFMQEKKDAAGNVIMNANGQPETESKLSTKKLKKEISSVEKERVKKYREFQGLQQFETIDDPTVPGGKKRDKDGNLLFKQDDGIEANLEELDFEHVNRYGYQNKLAKVLRSDAFIYSITGGIALMTGPIGAAVSAGVLKGIQAGLGGRNIGKTDRAAWQGVMDSHYHSPHVHDGYKGPDNSLASLFAGLGGGGHGGGHGHDDHGHGGHDDHGGGHH